MRVVSALLAKVVRGSVPILKIVIRGASIHDSAKDRQLEIFHRQ
jgi:hypothetical protein